MTVYDTDGTTVLCTDNLVGADGIWACTPTTPMAQGNHTITATATDAADNSSDASPAVSFTIDADAPDAPVIDDPATDDVVGDNTPTISGSDAEPGSTVTVYGTDGTTVLCTDDTVDITGAWSCIPSTPLPDGAQTVTATSTDAAGTESATSAPVTFTVDTAAPATPVIIDPAEGSSTNDLTPTVNGTAEAGSTVTVTEGPLTICTAQTNGQGSWTCTPTAPLLPGEHTFSATAEDAAGNQSVADTVTFTINLPGDTTAPAVPVITTPAEGSSTADTTPTVSGTAEPGSTVRVTEGGTTICTAQTNAQGGWSCTPTTALPVGQHTVTATATDAAGNTSPADSATFTITAGSSDDDGDGLPLEDETTHGTDANNPDTDGDGLTDGKEVKGYTIKQRVTITRSGKAIVIGTTRSNPTKADTDKDGLKDKAEMKGSKNKKFNRHKSDPSKCDTDRGGIGDGKEIRAGSDPAQIKSGPNDLESRMAARREGRGTIG